MYLLLFVLLFIVCPIFGVLNYNNTKLYRLTPTSEEQINLLKILTKNGVELVSLSVSENEEAKVLVKNEFESYFMEKTNEVGLKPEKLFDNIQELIDEEIYGGEVTATLGSMNWNRYQTLEEIYSWLDELPQLFPGVVEIIDIGKSYEGRSIKVVEIDFKRGIRIDPLYGMLEGGIHSVEWISPATVTWIIKEFLTSSDPDVKYMAEAFVWHILPVMNPDGYEYTHTTNRFWRKNRNPIYSKTCLTSFDSLSVGADLNRNFDFLWSEYGTSNDSCASNFHGSSPNSELEAAAVSSHIQNLKSRGNLIYYLTFHSYGQMVLIPYNHLPGSDESQSKNFDDLVTIGTQGIRKLQQRHGTQYVVGSGVDILYAVSGSSMDMAKGVFDVPISLGFELRPHLNNILNFLLPASQIIPNNEEVMDCLIEMDKTTRELGYYTYTSDGVKNIAGCLYISLSLVLLLVSL